MFSLAGGKKNTSLQTLYSVELGAPVRSLSSLYFFPRELNYIVRKSFNSTECSPIHRWERNRSVGKIMATKCGNYCDQRCSFSGAICLLFLRGELQDGKHAFPKIMIESSWMFYGGIKTFPSRHIVSSRPSAVSDRFYVHYLITRLRWNGTRQYLISIKWSVRGLELG